MSMPKSALIVGGFIATKLILQKSCHKHFSTKNGKVENHIQYHYVSVFLVYNFQLRFVTFFINKSLVLKRSHTISRRS